MTTSPVTTLTDELIAELEKEAWLCDSDTSMFMEPAVVVALLAERAELKEQVYTLGILLDNRQKLLDLMPECPAHGSCIPHAIEWLAELKKDAERLQKLADMMSLNYGRKDYGLWVFPADNVASERDRCNIDDLRSFIDSEDQE